MASHIDISDLHIFCRSWYPRTRHISSPNCGAPPRNSLPPLPAKLPPNVRAWVQAWLQAWLEAGKSRRGGEGRPFPPQRVVNAPLFELVHRIMKVLLQVHRTAHVLLHSLLLLALARPPLIPALQTFRGYGIADAARWLGWRDKLKFRTPGS